MKEDSGGKFISCSWYYGLFINHDGSWNCRERKRPAVKQAASKARASPCSFSCRLDTARFALKPWVRSSNLVARKKAREQGEKKQQKPKQATPREAFRSSFGFFFLLLQSKPAPAPAPGSRRAGRSSLTVNNTFLALILRALKYFTARAHTHPKLDFCRANFSGLGFFSRIFFPLVFLPLSHIYSWACTSPPTPFSFLELLSQTGHL